MRLTALAGNQNVGFDIPHVSTTSERHHLDGFASFVSVHSLRLEQTAMFRSASTWSATAVPGRAGRLPVHLRNSLKGRQGSCAYALEPASWNGLEVTSLMGHMGQLMLHYCGHSSGILRRRGGFRAGCGSCDGCQYYQLVSDFAADAPSRW